MYGETAVHGVEGGSLDGTSDSSSALHLENTSIVPWVEEYHLPRRPSGEVVPHVTCALQAILRSPAE